MAFGVQTLGRVLALTLACGLAGPSFAEDPPAPDLAGIYDLEGQTVVGETQARFIVTGKLVVKQEGNTIRTFVEADVKRSEGKTGPAAFSLVAHGQAIVNGRKLAGVTDVQTIMGKVPGVDVSAPYMPKEAGPTFQATSSGDIKPDGEIHFDMKSDTDLFGPGGDRVTTLRAVRVARKPTELKTKK